MSRNYPGKSSLKFNMQESKTNAKISLYNLENGFEMNDEMAAFLEDCPEFEIQVVTVLAGDMTEWITDGHGNIFAVVVSR